MDKTHRAVSQPVSQSVSQSVSQGYDIRRSYCPVRNYIVVCDDGVDNNDNHHHHHHHRHELCRIRYSESLPRVPTFSPTFRRHFCRSAPPVGPQRNSICVKAVCFHSFHKTSFNSTSVFGYFQLIYDCL